MLIKKLIEIIIADVAELESSNERVRRTEKRVRRVVPWSILCEIGRTNKIGYHKRDDAPARLPKKEMDKKLIEIIIADVAELADAPDLGSGAQACRFNPCHPHQKNSATRGGAIFLNQTGVEA